MIILWNKDGSIKRFVNNESVQQNSHNVNIINFACDGKDNTIATAEVLFELPNKDIVKKQAYPLTFEENGITYHGYTTTIDRNVTTYSGSVFVVCTIYQNATALYTYRFELTINPTMARAKIPSELTPSEYAQLLSKFNDYLQKFDIHNVRKYATLQEAEIEKPKMENKSVILIANDATNEYAFYQLIGGVFEPLEKKFYETLVASVPTDILKVATLDNDKIYLGHDGRKIEPQHGIQFARLNGNSIINSSTDLDCSNIVQIIGHNGTFSATEVKSLKYNSTIIHDVESNLFFHKSGEKVYTSLKRENDSTIRVWTLTYNASNQWTLNSEVIALRGEVVAPKAVTLVNARETATNGVLTEQEFVDLTSDTTSYIYFNKEKYNLADNMHNIGSMTYTHLGYENNVFVLKAITITLANKTWVLNEKELI